jgi:putative redox protein
VVRAPALLIGHSLGGAAVLAAAGDVPEARAVATIAAPADPSHVTGLLKDHVDEIRARGEVEVSLAGRPFRIRREFLDDVAEQRLDERIAKLRKALLVMHAPGDDIVGIDNASHIFLAAKHPKSFVSLADADHLLSNPRDAAYVADVIAAWAGRYLDMEAAPEVSATEPRTVLVTETRASKFQQTIRAGRHTLTADEPVAAGGLDSGPNPYDLLLAGLGACTSMTLRLYADRKQLPLERVSVKLAHSRIHAEDCETCETKEGMLDRIDKEITVSGPLDEDARARLLEIAEKCPVNRTLKSEIDIRGTIHGD